MRLFWKRAVAPRAVAGYPDTDKVVAKRLRVQGDRIRSTGPVLLRNGSNSFLINAGAFTHLAVEADNQGVHNLVGRHEIGGPATVLASFGFHEAALSANDALLKAHANLGSGSTKFSILKWFGAAVGLYVMATVVGASAGAASTQIAGAHPTMVTPASMAAQPATGAAGQGGTYNPSEPTLEQLAAGQYRFEPKLQAPQVELPALECAQPGAKQK